MLSTFKVRCEAGLTLPFFFGVLTFATRYLHRHNPATISQMAQQMVQVMTYIPLIPALSVVQILARGVT